MKTNRPTAERMLSQFHNLNLLIQEGRRTVQATLLGGLTMLQKRILLLLRLPEKIYELSFSQAKIEGVA